MSILSSGGFMMYPILAVSVLGLFIIIERSVYFFQFKNSPGPLLARVDEFLSNNQDHSAITLCREVKQPIGPILAVIIENRKSSKLEVEKLAQAEAQKIIPLFEKWLTILQIVGTSSPLLGLLGTVVGMIQSFAVISQGDVASAGVAAGISTALYTTAFGLIVALPSVVAYNLFNLKVESLVNDMEIVATEFISKHVKN